MKRIRLAAVLLALVLAAGCAGGGGAAPEGAPGQENRLVLYTSHKEEVYWPIVKEFEERTGIWVEVVAGGTNELLERIRREADAPGADVMFGGGVESLEAYRDCFTPYACAQAEDLQPQFRDAQDLWTPFSALPVVLVYNTKLLRPGQLTGWADLLAPELRGRVAFADPAVSGSSFTALVTLLQALGEEDGGGETLQRFAAHLDGRQLEGSGEVLSAVASGAALAGVTLEETALKRIAAGDDVAMVYPAEGTSCVPDASALIQNAAHRDNARRFLDFTVSPEVQRLLTEQLCRRSVREPGGALETLTPLADIPLVDYDVARASGRREALLMSWAFYLSGEEAPS